MFTSSILAQGSDGGGGGGSLSFLLILVAVPLVMYFLMIRPQRKRMRQQAELQNAIGVGDEVVTTSGVYGFITGVEDDKFWLEIDDDVQIRIAKAAIQGRVGGAEATDEPDTRPDTKADKSARADKAADKSSKADAKAKPDKAGGDQVAAEVDDEVADDADKK